MTVREAKEILENVRRTERAYRSAADIAAAFRLRLTGGRGVRYDRQGCPGAKGNRTEDGLVRLADYEAERDVRFEEMVAARKRAERLIASLSDPVEREVLTRRYIFGERWEEIAGKMNYTSRRIFQIHDNALKHFSKFQ